MKLRNGKRWGFGVLLALCGGSAWAGAGASLPAVRPWWQGAVIYEIYPRSFQDSNGDGIGDLNGITQRLDYLQRLGVDAIWLTPIYPSPLVDFGYDIADYEAIDPSYGNLQDFDRLIAAAKQHGIRVVMDLVLNHTSDQHPWFQASRRGKRDPRRDWYIWRDGKGPGRPPSNWQSKFGGSAWQFDPASGQYYYHKFYVQQPDLNWDNPEVRAAMQRVMRFWLDRGVAGFRLDAITMLYEDPDLTDEAVVTDAQGRPVLNAYGEPQLDERHTDDQPRVHEALRGLRQVADSYSGRDIVLIGETYLQNIAALRRMYGQDRDELHLAMDMQFALIDRLDARLFRQRLLAAQQQLGGNEPLLLFDNHDNPRWPQRYGDGRHDAAIGRLLAAVLLASRGTALLYYGDEIGMHTSTPTRKEAVRDPIGKRGWPKEKGRDGERTPMQWSAEPGAGFTVAGVVPWLPLAADYPRVNVAAQLGQADSQLSWYRQLIALRRREAAMAGGRQILFDTSDPAVLAWARAGAEQGHGAGTVIVICNFSPQPRPFQLQLPSPLASRGPLHTLLKSPGMPEPTAAMQLQLPPYGVYIGRL